MPPLAFTSPRSAAPFLFGGLVLFLLVSSFSGDDTLREKASRLRTSVGGDRWLASSSKSGKSNETSGFSTFAFDPTGTLDYRNRLHLATSPEPLLTHSPTMTFDHIYVLSLPSRQDRRDTMLKLADALGLRITFVDAVSKEEPFIRWIAERAAEVRDKKARAISKARGTKASKIGGLAIGTDWLAQVPAPNMTFPPMTDKRWRDKDWVEYLEDMGAQGRLDELKPTHDQVSVLEIMHDANENIEGRQVNEGVISTYWGHTRAMRRVIENNDKSALILEDDVDFEWDIEKMWALIARRLPDDWETAFLGHCWGRELLRPVYLHPDLHKSTQPLCLHGYALSDHGARHLVQLLSNPWSAYLTAVDTAVPSFIKLGMLTSFSVDPPLIVQRKDSPSDIQEGAGSKWRGVLRDSTMERIWIDEGVEVPKPFFDETITDRDRDPATYWRYGRVCRPHPDTPPALAFAKEF